MTPGSPPADVVALVPMRHHSERVPGKNFRPLAGKPLYAHILEALLACSGIAQIIVDTDSPTIREGVAAAYPQVRLIERPEALRGGEVSTNAVLLHDVSQAPARFYLQTHATNPLLRPETISRAVNTYLQSYPDSDSLFSVTRWHKRLWSAEGRPVNHDPEVLLRTQDLPPVFEENSCLYLFERQAFLERRNRIGRRPRLFEIALAEAWDIDEEPDFEIAELLLRARGRAA